MQGKPLTDIGQVVDMAVHKKAIFVGPYKRHIPASHVLHWQMATVVKMLNEQKLFLVAKKPKPKQLTIPLSRVTPENIVSLEETQVFVFGSNMAGRHGGGAARLAYERFGARMGMGWGYVGSSYAIPTKDINIQTLPINEIFPWVHTFIESVKDSHLTFLVTEIGCGLAGYEPKDIAPLFKEAMDVPNIHLPLRFWEILINL